MEDFTNNHNVRLYGKDSTLIFYALLIEALLLGQVSWSAKEDHFFFLN